MRRFVVSLLVGGCICTPAQPVKVYPRIETGAHSAVVRRIDTDAAERYLVSASDDKTARVWDLRSGRLLKVLRPPIGDGAEGRFYAVAVSPDGLQVAAGGFTGKNGSGEHPIFVFDRKSGALRKTITGIPDATHNLAYSKDGRYLAAALGGGNGIRIYKAGGYSEVARDEQYGDSSYWAEFDGSGRLVTTSYDGSVRLYGSDFHLLQKSEAPGGKRPFSARFSPDGKRIAVGFADTMAVDVLSASDLSFLYSVPTPAQDASFFVSVLWTRDGQNLCAAGFYHIDSLRPTLCWGDAGKGKMSTFPTAVDTVEDILALNGGAIAFSSGEGTVGLLDRTGVRQWRAAPDLLDYRDNAPRVSSDGNDVEVNPLYFNGSKFANYRINFSVSDERLETDGQPSGISLQAPATTGLAIDNWKNSEHPTFGGHPLLLDRPYEISRSLAISSGKDKLD